MALEDYSELHQSLISKMKEQDGGFHTRGFLADVPFSQISSVSEDGTEIILDHVSVEVTTDNDGYKATLLRSDENECWYLTMETADETYRGLLNFNVLYNARGRFAFSFVSDNTGSDFGNITRNIKYADLLILEL